MAIKESDYSFCNVVGRTDVGCRRSVNEDSIGKADTLNGLAVVICDGMGGNVGGKVASETAVDAILIHLKEHHYPNPKEAISNSIMAANRAVLKKAQLHPELTGMGCTCVLLIVDKNGIVYVGHIGDSRVYLIRDNLANHLTKDQSYVQMLVDEGSITPQEAEKHPRNNEITNAVGMTNMTPPVIRDSPLNPVAGDCFLLCSDGLNKVVAEDEIVKIAGAHSLSTDRKAEMLINAARSKGAPDNISVQLVEFSVSPSEIILAKQKKRWIILFVSVVFLAFLIPLTHILFRGVSDDGRDEENGREVVSQPVVAEKKGTVENNGKFEVPSHEESKSGIDSYIDGDVKFSKDKTDEKESDLQEENYIENNSQKADSCFTISPPETSQEVSSEKFRGEIKKFHAQEDTLPISPPKAYNKAIKNSKYTVACCNRSDYHNKNIAISEDGAGGLIIIKINIEKRPEKMSYLKGYEIIIDKVVIDNKLSNLPEEKQIKIVFE